MGGIGPALRQQRLVAPRAPLATQPHRNSSLACICAGTDTAAQKIAAVVVISTSAACGDRARPESRIWSRQCDKAYSGEPNWAALCRRKRRGASRRTRRSGRSATASRTPRRAPSRSSRPARRRSLRRWTEAPADPRAPHVHAHAWAAPSVVGVGSAWSPPGVCCCAGGGGKACCGG